MATAPVAASAVVAASEMIAREPRTIHGSLSGDGVHGWLEGSQWPEVVAAVRQQVLQGGASFGGVSPALACRGGLGAIEATTSDRLPDRWSSQ